MDANEGLEQLLGQIMLREGIITRDQLDRALGFQARESSEHRRPLGKILVEELGACTQQQLTVAVMQQYALLSAAEIVQ